MKTRVNTCCEDRNTLAVTNMPNSVERSSKSKKNKLDNFIWPDDKVKLLLNVVLEHKTARTMENVGLETCQTKYAVILDLFRAQYPSKSSITVAWFRVFASSSLYLRGFVIHTKTIFTRVNIFTL